MITPSGLGDVDDVAARIGAVGCGDAGGQEAAALAQGIGSAGVYRELAFHRQPPGKPVLPARRASSKRRNRCRRPVSIHYERRIHAPEMIARWAPAPVGDLRGLQLRAPRRRSPCRMRCWCLPWRGSGVQRLDQRHEPGIGIGVGIGGVEPIDIREQHHGIGARCLTDAGGESVIVAEADFSVATLSFSLTTERHRARSVAPASRRHSGSAAGPRDRRSSRASARRQHYESPAGRPRPGSARSGRQLRPLAHPPASRARPWAGLRRRAPSAIAPDETMTICCPARAPRRQLGNQARQPVAVHRSVGCHKQRRADLDDEALALVRRETRAPSNRRPRLLRFQLSLRFRGALRLALAENIFAKQWERSHRAASPRPHRSRRK